MKQMSVNVGKTDAYVRVVIGIVTLLLTIMPFVNDSWGFLFGVWPTAIVFGIITVIMFVTSYTKKCPLYKAIGVNTAGE